MRHILFLIGLALLPLSAQAATFELGGNDSLNCRMTMRGAIEPGDAQRFREFLAHFLNHATEGQEHALQTRYGFQGEGVLRLCLDSPGGSLTEAIEMADTLAFDYRVRSEIAPHLRNEMAPVFVAHIGTAVPDGARCESACAILFLAGGYFSREGVTENLREPDRVLHVNGKLGFHAPALRVSDGDYSQRAVNRAFALAVESIERLAERRRRYRLPSELFERIVSTPPDEMFHVRTVAEATSWEIKLAGVPAIRAPSPGNLWLVCSNHTKHAAPGFTHATMYRNLAPDEIRADTSQMFHSTGEGLTGVRDWINRDGSLTWDGFGRRGADIVTIDAQDCKGRLDVATQEMQFDAPMANETGYYVSGDHRWAMYPPYVTLATLGDLALTARDGWIEGATWLTPVVEEFEAHCGIYDTGRLVSEAPCRSVLHSRETADVTQIEATNTAIWPDGTSLVTQSGQGLATGGWRHLGRWGGWSFDDPSTPQELALWDSFDPGPLHPITAGCFERLADARVYCLRRGDLGFANVDFWDR